MNSVIGLTEGAVEGSDVNNIKAASIATARLMNEEEKNGGWGEDGGEKGKTSGRKRLRPPPRLLLEAAMRPNGHTENDHVCA